MSYVKCFYLFTRENLLASSVSFHSYRWENNCFLSHHRNTANWLFVPDQLPWLKSNVSKDISSLNLRLQSLNELPGSQGCSLYLLLLNFGFRLKIRWLILFWVAPISFTLQRLPLLWWCSCNCSSFFVKTHTFCFALLHENKMNN